MMVDNCCIWLPSYPSYNLYSSTPALTQDPILPSFTKFIRATTVVDFIGKGVPAFTKTDGYFVSASSQSHSSQVAQSQENATTPCCYESGGRGLFRQVLFRICNHFWSSNDSTTYTTKVFQNLLSIRSTKNVGPKNWMSSSRKVQNEWWVPFVSQKRRKPKIDIL